MITVGPYEFTFDDAASTLQLVGPLLDLYPPAAQEQLEPLRADLTRIAVDEPIEDAIRLVFPRLLQARQTAEQAGTLPATATGTVAQLNTSAGGVPKLPVPKVEVDFGGITTDSQKTRKHHGRPFQALCLWSSEIIDELRADDHPIFPGATGENITVAGLDWPSLTMGTQLAIGQTLVQISAYAIPCAHQAQWFTDRDFSRLNHNNGPISRLYATVIEPGAIAVGDTVIVEP